jgi:hypothetical protein
MPEYSVSPATQLRESLSFHMCYLLQPLWFACVYPRAFYRTYSAGNMYLTEFTSLTKKLVAEILTEKILEIPE